MMPAIVPDCVWPVAATLGEGACWDAAARRVLFVDIKGRRLHRYDPAGGGRESWQAPGQIGFALPCADGTLICGVQGGLFRFAPSSGQFTCVLPLEADLPGNRLNDAYVDGGGQLWFGSMDDAEAAPTGRLYRVGQDDRVSAHDAGYVITNGPAASPDGRTLYHTDTLRRLVYAFDLGDDGVPRRRRVFVAIRERGYPDGMAVDAEGGVWIALFDGARIERYAPDGRLLGQVAFPCANVTKLAFGGDDLRTVYATTATKGLSEAERHAQPLAGALFAFRAPLAGLAPAVCTVRFAQAA
ncbi:SMP-30/gluconolactonase/LRE family protein [Burkholderia glumae]|uniref:SMP-30/gluconolactonase/LRE family protein n=1 Tax=Burkholderia glumae TaxID=337 RepID=UPI0020368855|nr:SMP-30/gluconolactonase/LRE family protein [Burkholderia glumae]MCM2537862.1 SMP-30/gluconolactonase/LRE family protein [Burkholderia glumae]